MEPLDIDHLRSWIGRTEAHADIVTPQLVARYRATLGGPVEPPPEGEAAPLGIHWCLSPPTVPMDGIGPDGHAKRGGFLPPVPLPRRMWAGGRIAFHTPILVGDTVERHSRILDVTVKDGRSGRLCFVAVEHRLMTLRGLAREERHDIVYRGITPQPAPSTPPEDKAHKRATIHGSPVLLFRYSALTFNGHRIHYDRRYCIEEEGYPGLVVHGPLQANLLLELAAREWAPEELRVFDYRGLRPLFDGSDFTLHAERKGAALDLWVRNADGHRTMAASATA